MGEMILYSYFFHKMEEQIGCPEMHLDGLLFFLGNTDPRLATPGDVMIDAWDSCPVPPCVDCGEKSVIFRLVAGGGSEPCCASHYKEVWE